MKGIARIIETIIASIIILTSLSFFLTGPVKTTNWDITVSEIRAQDAMAAVYGEGNLAIYIRNNDDVSLRSTLSNIFPASTDFSINIRGIPNPIIFLGCVCSIVQLNDIETRLDPLFFVYKERDMEIRVERVTVSDPKESDILLFMDFDDLDNNYTDPNSKNKIDQFLENGGTIFLLDDLTQTDAGSTVMVDIFNLSWKSGVPSGAGNLYDVGNPERISYNVAKYYENTTGGTGPFIPFNFISHIDIDNNTIIADGVEQFSFVKGNKNVINGNGRTLWFAENGQGAINDLTRAAIMWASGENYKMDGAVVKTPPLTSRRANIFIHDLDTYEFSITTWNIF